MTVRKYNGSGRGENQGENDFISYQNQVLMASSCGPFYQNGSYYINIFTITTGSSVCNIPGNEPNGYSLVF